MRATRRPADVRASVHATRRLIAPGAKLITSSESRWRPTGEHGTVPITFSCLFRVLSFSRYGVTRKHGHSSQDGAASFRSDNMRLPSFEHGSSQHVATRRAAFDKVVVKNNACASLRETKVGRIRSNSSSAGTESTRQRKSDARVMRRLPSRPRSPPSPAANRQDVRTRYASPVGNGFRFHQESHHARPNRMSHHPHP